MARNIACIPSSLRFDTPVDPVEGNRCAVGRSAFIAAGEVEDCAGTARDGASDDGHALCGQFGAGLGLDGRSQAVGLGQSCLHFGEFVGVHGLVDSESLGVPPRSGFGHSCRRAAFPVPGNGQEGLFHRGRRPPSGHHSQPDDDSQAPSGPAGGRFAQQLACGHALPGQLVEVGDAAGFQQIVVCLLHRRRRGPAAA